MSNRIDLGVARSLELVARARLTVAEFAKKEDRLAHELQTRRYDTQRKHHNALRSLEGGLAAQIAETDSRFNAEAARIRAVHERRLSRVQRAHATAVRTLPMRAQSAKGNLLGRLQMQHLRNERTLASGLAAADSEFAGFTAHLNDQGHALAHAEEQARKSFRGFGSASTAGGVQSDDASALLEEFRQHLGTFDQHLQSFRQSVVRRAFGFVPLPALIAIVLVPCLGIGILSGFGSSTFGIAGIATILLLVAVLLIRRAQLGGSGSPAAQATGALLSARATHNACYAAAEANRQREQTRLKETFERTNAEIVSQWNTADTVEEDFKRKQGEKLETQFPRVSSAIERTLKARVDRIETEHIARLDEINRVAETEKRQLTEASDAETASLQADEKERWNVLEDEWKRSITPVYAAIEEMNAVTAMTFPEWTLQVAEKWTPPVEFTPATKFGTLRLDLTRRVEGVPPLSKLALPGPPQISIPLSLEYPFQGSLLLESNESGGAIVTAPLNNIILRLLATTPPGKLSLTIIDPVGLGQNFASVMHLADYEEALINRRIWTQRDQIDERLGELNEHIEKVIQMYLRNEYETITQYNEQAGSIAEKYHFLVVADFPAGFSDAAAMRLQSIAISGPRCGVFTLIHWDQRLPHPDGFAPDELRKTSICIRRTGSEFVLGREQTEAGAELVFDMPPEPEVALDLIHKIGKSSIDSSRVEVPFSQIAPKPSEMWTNDTTNELRIPVGRTGATKLQYLAIGKGTRQHALFAGKTGSGKSTLFHVIITNLALACSPDQVEFYLIDFKKGVEFKCYASKRLPHARVVAIESDREFALSVLQRVDDELKRRGDLFRKLGVQDLAGYKRVGGTEPMPRSLLLIDEFQEFFVEDDTIAQTASLLFDRIVRQGRAFGIHVLLGSQSLGGAYSLARATLGQMVIRVALQCNEADAYLIMDDSNPAPRLLSRPGEGIYNDAGGAIEGNSPFQVVWLPDSERDRWLDKVRDIERTHNDRYPSPIVFEGNAPADIRENDLFRIALDTQPVAAPHAARCWLGAPNSIKGPTEAVFQRQSGNHLLVVGQRDEGALTILGLTLLALAAQYPVGMARFIFLHATSPGSPDAEFLQRIVEAVPHTVEMPATHEIPDAMSSLAATIKERASGESEASGAPTVFLLIHGLHKFKKLRQEDEFSFSNTESGGNPGAQFNDLICEGSSLGMHIVATVDTLNNLNRSMSRKALSEFEMRVVFQMSANDSAGLIDSPKASNLGLHRALFYNEQAGYLETFRPYAPPDAEWIQQAAGKLAQRRK